MKTKNVLIVGASSGLGTFILKELNKKKFKIYATYNKRRLNRNIDVFMKFKLDLLKIYEIKKTILKIK